MVAGRRSVSVSDAEAWVFNRMVDAYVTRPPYPAALVDSIAELAASTGPRIADVGAGVGHLALPLAARGLDVVAIEPARAMLSRLEADARLRDLRIRAEHAAAEALPLDARSVDLVLIADALHFIDADLAPVQVKRVLARRGGLAIVLSDFADTAFMRGVVEAIYAAAPRRPRDMAQAAVQVFATSQVPVHRDRLFLQEVPVDDLTLENVLRSISFIGPAMNRERFGAFRERVLALPGPKVWSRTFRLLTGRRR
jgi:SAM-dependent methyltransferase